MPSKFARRKKSLIHSLATPKLLALIVVFLFAGTGAMVFARSMAAPAAKNQQEHSTDSEIANQATENKSSMGEAAKQGTPATPPPATAPTPPAVATPKSTSPKTTTPTPAPPPAAGTGTSRKVKITYYGAYDNDPPGSQAIAHPVIHQSAGGTGSYADPLTFASPTGTGEYPWGQIIYVPSLQKYFIREDTCGVSWTAPDGCGGVDMVDLYVGNPSTSINVIQCEEALTVDGNVEIIVSPAANLTYDATPLWNQATGACASLH